MAMTVLVEVDLFVGVGALGVDFVGVADGG